MMITAELVYEAFRRFLVKQLRIYSDGSVIHVGEATNCLRKAYYNRKYGSTDLSHLAPSKRVIMGLGLSTHLVFEEILKEMGYTTEQQILIDTGMGFKLAGTPDAVNEDHVVEIKTCNKLPDDPYPHHVMQLNAYLGMTNKKRGYLVYICKRDGNVRVFTVEYREDLYRELLERAKKLYEALKNDVEPSPEPSYICNYCEWRYNCYYFWE